jgi:hypothetical protein
MGRRNPLTGKLDPGNWKTDLSTEIESTFSDINSAKVKESYLRTLNHPSAEDAVKRMAVVRGGVETRIILDSIRECHKSSSRRWPPPEPIQKKDLADLRRIQKKIKGLISFGLQPEFFGLHGRNVSLPRRTFTDDQILECLAMTEATLRFAVSVQRKRGVGNPGDPRKLDLAKNLEALFRREIGKRTPLHGAIGDWIKAAFNDDTKWPAGRVKKLLQNKRG